MRFYLEPSVLVKAFKLEENSDKIIDIINLFERKEGWYGFTSKWSLLEVARALRKDGKPEELISLNLDELRRHEIVFASVSDEMLEESKDIVTPYDVYASDALHVATFRFLERKERLDGFLCDDRHYHQLRKTVSVLKLNEIQLPQKFKRILTAK